MHTARQMQADVDAGLSLEPAPATEQLAPAESRRVPMIVSVAGNLLVAAALLGSLLLAPAFLSGWFPPA